MSEFIRKKVLSKYFEQIISGAKRFEFRKVKEGEEYVADETYLFLDEIDDNGVVTGRACKCLVTYVLRSEEIKGIGGVYSDCVADGFVILGIRPVMAWKDVAGQNSMGIKER